MGKRKGVGWLAVLFLCLVLFCKTTNDAVIMFLSLAILHWGSREFTHSARSGQASGVKNLIQPSTVSNAITGNINNAAFIAGLLVIWCVCHVYIIGHVKKKKYI